MPEVSCQYSASTRSDMGPGRQVSWWLCTSTTSQGRVLMSTLFCVGAVVLKPMEDAGAVRMRGLPPSLEPAIGKLKCIPEQPRQELHGNLFSP